MLCQKKEYARRIRERSTINLESLTQSPNLINFGESKRVSLLRITGVNDIIGAASLEEVISFIVRTIVLELISVGDYKMDYSKRSTGANWGGYLGSKAGEFLGGGAQKLFGNITGLGDYAVQKNVFLGGRLPQVNNSSDGGGTVIRFQEYLGDVITSATAGDFKISTYNLNPGDSGTFPWLHQVAANYEQFEFEGVVFQFRSTSANALNSTNTALGSVMMCTQYNVLDTPFSSKGEMLNYEFSTSGKPADSNMHMIECARSVTPVDILYTLTGLVPTGADPRLYNLGKFSIATTGFQAAAVNIGELHITYQVRLIKPKLDVALGGVIDSYYRLLGNSATTLYSGAAPLGFFATNPASIMVTQDTIGIQLDFQTIFWPASAIKNKYLVVLNWYGDTAQPWVPPVLTPTLGVITQPWYSPVNPTTANRVEMRFVFTTFGKPGIPNVQLGTSGLLPTASSVSATQSIIITQLNPAVL